MTLQLHDNGLSAWNWRKAARFAPNPYYQGARLFGKTRFGKKVFGNLPNSHRWASMLNEIEGTPTYAQFIREANVTGMEESGELAGKFGTWIKTKAVPGLQKIQGALSPVIGLLPGGGIVNAAFDVIKKPGQAPEPVVTPIMPAPMAPQQFEPMAPNFPMAPAPAFFPQIAPPSGGINLPFGLDLKTLALLGVGGVLAYKLLKK